MNTLAPILNLQNIPFIADVIAPMLPWPTYIVELADKMAEVNKDFDKEKFLKRALKNWEDNYEPPTIDDSIPY